MSGRTTTVRERLGSRARSRTPIRNSRRREDRRDFDRRDRSRTPFNRNPSYNSPRRDNHRQKSNWREDSRKKRDYNVSKNFDIRETIDNRKKQSKASADENSRDDLFDVYLGDFSYLMSQPKDWTNLKKRLPKDFQNNYHISCDSKNLKKADIPEGKTIRNLIICFSKSMFADMRKDDNQSELCDVKITTWMDSNMKSFKDSYKASRVHLVMHGQDPILEASLLFWAHTNEGFVCMNLSDKYCQTPLKELENSKAFQDSVTDRIKKHLQKYSPKVKDVFSPNKLVDISDYQF